MDTAALRAFGLSQAKATALRDLAEKTLTGVVPSWEVLMRMSDDAIVAQLTQVRGIGVWTVQMLLIFEMGRMDVMPSLDLGVQKGFAKVYGKKTLPKSSELEAFASKKWRPYRSVAAWYMWRALEL